MTRLHAPPPLPRQRRIERAGIDGARIVRHGLADILAWLGEHPGPDPGDHRTIRWHHWTPWNTDVLDAALQRHPTDTVTAISETVRAHRRLPNALPTRVLADGHWLLCTDVAEIVLHPTSGTITRVRVRPRTNTKATPRTRPTPTGPRLKGGKGHGRGPTTWTELRSWLADAGHTFAQVKSGHIAVYGPTGRRIASLPGTPSDVRALTIATAALRNATGLRLRQPNPTDKA